MIVLVRKSQGKKTLYNVQKVHLYQAFVTLISIIAQTPIVTSIEHEDHPLIEAETNREKAVTRKVTFYGAKVGSDTVILYFHNMAVLV